MAGPFATGGRAAPGPFPCSRPHPSVVDELGTWHSIPGPSFPSGPQVIEEYAVEPLRPDHIYVSNGVSVMRTDDGGCRWQTAYALPASGAPGEMSAANAKILEIEVSAPGVVYLPIQQATGAGPRPRLLASRDAGATWNPAEGGVFVGIVGVLHDFDAPLQDPGVAYALVDIENQDVPGITVDASQALLATSDGGATWEARELMSPEAVVTAPGVGVTITGGGDFQGLTANPIRSEEVWLYGEAGTLLSAGPTSVDMNLGGIGVLDVSLDGSTVVAYGRDAATGHALFPGEESFQAFDPLTLVTSASAATPPFVAAESLGRVYLHVVAPGVSDVFDVSPRDGRSVSGMRTAPGDGFLPLVFGHTNNSIEVLVIEQEPEAPVEEIKTDLVPPGAVKDAGILRPRFRKLSLRPGEAETVAYRLAVPPAPTPLDVYFLIDVSGSMGGTINGVRSAMQEIVDRLAHLDIDVNFGVGAFRAFGDPPVYARARDIGPVDGALRTALNSLQASGGGAETQMAALYESVTGEGKYGVEPGLNMHFRPGSLRVAILATDEPISQGGNHPPYTLAIEALADKNVKQVGLAIQEPPLLGDPDYDDPGEPAATLQRVASGSKAVAPPGGVDCDGDDKPEIDEGGPIVCLIPPSRSSESDLMADAIVHVLEAVQDIQDVGVSALPAAEVTGAEDIVESISPSFFPGRDLKRPQYLPFDLTVRCPDVTSQSVFPLEVKVGTPSALVLGRATLIVVCDPLAGPRQKEPDEAFPVTAFVPVVGLPLPPPRPPEPVPEPNPNPQPNPQNNPQGGFVAEEQKQPQAAIAHQESQPITLPEEAAGDQYLMSRHVERSSGPSPGAIFLGGAVTMSLIYGFATMWREQIRTQYARGGRSRHRR